MSLRAKKKKNSASLKNSAHTSPVNKKQVEEESKLLKQEFNDLFLTGVNSDQNQNDETIPELETLGVTSNNKREELVLPLELRPRPKTSSSIPTETQMEISKKLEGMPGGLRLSALESKKYFGSSARNQLFDRFKYIDRQLKISHADEKKKITSLYFDDTSHKELVSNFPFAPRRPGEQAVTGVAMSTGDGASTTATSVKEQRLEMDLGLGSYIHDDEASVLTNPMPHSTVNPTTKTKVIPRAAGRNQNQQPNEDILTIVGDLSVNTNSTDQQTWGSDAAPATPYSYDDNMSVCENFQNFHMARFGNDAVRPINCNEKGSTSSSSSFKTRLPSSRSSSAIGRDRYINGSIRNSHNDLKIALDTFSYPDSARSSSMNSLDGTYAAHLAGSGSMLNTGLEHLDLNSMEDMSQLTNANTNIAADVGVDKGLLEELSVAGIGSDDGIVRGAISSKSNRFLRKKKRRRKHRSKTGKDNNDSSSDRPSTAPVPTTSPVPTTALVPKIPNAGINAEDENPEILDPFSVPVHEIDLDSMDQTEDTVDSLLSNMEIPISPRSAYLAGCARDKLNPRPSLIVRKQLVKELNLQHQGMGDRMAVILAESLKSLPFVQSINLCDNNLTDVGMSPVLTSILTIPNLLQLNLSNNIIGPKSAQAMADYLSSDNCPLVRLELHDADVDDYECQNFVTAIKRNKNLREIDLSNNKIGLAENLNTVMPDLITGGEALADLLRHPTCPLETLKLSWNMLRLDGAVDFVSSLRVNKTLTYLDLSYNALGKEAGIVLGDAILDNHTLKHLILCNNGIQSLACFTICQGIIENYQLQTVALDGNPIGEQGARALMMIPMFAGSRCKITAARCNIGIRDGDVGAFNLANPADRHELHLDRPYDRAKAFAILRIVAQHQTLVISKAVHIDQTRNSKGVLVNGKPETLDLIQVVSTEKECYLNEKMKKKVHLLKKLIENATDPTHAFQIFDVHDVDGIGDLTLKQFHSVLKAIGLNDISLPDVAEIVQQYDVTGSQMISKDEFRMYLQQQLDSSIKQLSDLIEEPMFSLSSAPKTEYAKHARYVPPRSGVLYLNVTDGFIKKKVYRAVSAADRDNIFDVAHSSGESVQMIKFSVQNVRLRLEETMHLYDTIYAETRNKVKTVQMLVPYMSDFNEAKHFVTKITDDDRVEINQIKQGLGAVIKPIFGQCDGFYSLDMSKSLDVLCLCRLLEISRSVGNMRMMENFHMQNYIRDGKGSSDTNMDHMGNDTGLRLGDTSQHCNWSCFRNESKDGIPIEISVESFSPLPTRGIVEFDFICGKFVDVLRSSNSVPTVTESNKPGPKSTGKFQKQAVATGKNIPPTEKAHIQRTVGPLNDRRFLRILTNGCLILEEDHHDMLVKLNKYREKCEKSLIVTSLTTCGHSTVHERERYVANSLFEHMDLFYSKLPKRGEALQIAARNEEIKVDYTNACFEANTAPVYVPRATLWLGERETDSPSQLERNVESPTKLNSKFSDAVESVPSTTLPTVTPASTGRRGANAGRKTILRPPNKAAQAEEAARQLARAKEKALAARIAAISYVFDPLDPDLQPNPEVVPDQVSTVPSIAISRQNSQLPGELPSTVPVISRQNSFIPDGEVKGSKLLSPRLRTASDSSRLASSKAKSKAELEAEAAALAQEKEKKESSNTLVQIARLKLILANATDPEVLADAEKRLFQLKTDKNNARKVNFKKILLSPQVSAYAKAARVIEFLEEMLTKVFITCRQLALLMEIFTQGSIWKAEPFGTYRVELVVSLFSRVLDIHNFEFVLSVLDIEEQACVICRLGWFNIFNPMKPEGYYTLNISRREDRQFAKFFVALSIVEPGINWKNQTFRWSMEEEVVPGWDLTTGWTKETEMPTKGIVSFCYFSGGLDGAEGCKPDVDFRRALCSQTLVNEYDLVSETTKIQEGLFSLNASTKALITAGCTLNPNVNTHVSLDSSGKLLSMNFLSRNVELWSNYLLKVQELEEGNNGIGNSIADSKPTKDAINKKK